MSFFFSSRRRHTRFDCDWSSDVCSSDLAAIAFSIVEGTDLAIAADEATFGLSEINFRMFPGGSVSKSLANMFHSRDALRSEERRVGKECRCRWTADE